MGDLIRAERIFLRAAMDRALRETTKPAEFSVEDLPEGALVLEPREFYDKAIVGYGDVDDQWGPRGPVVIYDTEKTLEAIMEMAGCDYEGALEWFGYNTCGAYVGPDTPGFRSADEGD